MSGRVEDGEEQHGISQLPVEPNVLVQREPSDLRSNPSDDGAADGKQDEHTINAEDQACTSRNPDGELECVQWCQSWLSCLFPPWTNVLITGAAGNQLN